MASPQGGLGSLSLGDGRDTDSSTHSGSGGSHVGSGESSSSATPCHWKTAQYHDQECSRYFDCPTHVLERASTADGPDEAHAPPATSNDVEEVTPSPPQETHSSPVDISSDSPQENLDTVASELSGSPATRLNALRERPTGGPRRARPLSFPARTSSIGGHHSSYIDENDMIAQASRRSSADLRVSTTRELYGDRQRQVSMDQSRIVALRGAHATEDTLSRTDSAQPSLDWSHGPTDGTPASEFVLPRWQPDAEVTYCPICQTQFSIFVRKHHCRKCGRVVCNSCSPHRIIIPHPFIVRPPGSEVSLPQNLLIDDAGSRYFDGSALSGGERVRLCNPCVPDPNTAPPQSPTSPESLSPRSSHHRSRSTLNAYGVAPSTNRYGGVFTGTNRDTYRYYSPRTRSITMGSGAQASPGGSSSRTRGSGHAVLSPLDQYLAMGPSSLSSIQFRSRYGSAGETSSSSRQRALPPTPQIAEEDECPVCHRELPSQGLPNFEALREAHINTCIQSHSAYGSPTPVAGTDGPAPPPPVPRRTGMYTYPATEKDCIDDAECTICLEEFTVGIPMARLECLCRFHRACIAAWFVNHPGRCPVHQHDGFGY